MTYHFRPAKRENVPLLLGVAGGTGAGKTMSALLIARGIANGQPFAGIDTENQRMNHYADLFPELHVAQITAPFRPEMYADAIDSAFAYLAQQQIPQKNRVVLVDSMSHEWTGHGGCLEWQEEEMRGDESRRLLSWQKPKRDHRRMVTRLLQVPGHVVLCFRASERVEMIDDPQKPGKKKVVPKRSLTGLDGWIPEGEPKLPYELTASFLLLADKPGFPRPIKLPEPLKPFVPLDRPLSEETGRQLAAWAAGESQGEEPRARGAVTPTTVPTAAHTSDRVEDFSPSPADEPSSSPEISLEQLRSTVPPAELKRIGGELYPGRTAGSLTADERATILAEHARQGVLG